MNYSRNTQFQAAIDEALSVLQRRGILCICGPSGSGKTHLVTHLHRLSDANQPLIITDAAALSSNRLESQLFGHVKGAFSGADRDHGGLLAAAAKGFLCIESLEDLDQAVQAKCLRILQERSYRPLGATVERPFEGGFIFTCNRHPQHLKQEGLLREDFVFRISGHILAMPDLDARKTDIPDIASDMAQTLANQLGFSPPDPAQLTPIISATYPGRFHGLQSAVQHILITGIPPEMETVSPVALKLPDHGTLKEDLAALERALIQRAVDRHPDSRDDQAEALGISRRALQYKLKDHDFLQ